MSRGVALLSVALLTLAGVGVFTSWLDARTAARVEAERARRHRRLEEAALALSARVDRAGGLARALADAGSLREVVLEDDGPAEGWGLLDRLLPRLAADDDVGGVRVLREDGAPLVGYDRRPRPPAPPLAAPAPPEAARRALAAPAGGAAFDLALEPEGARLVAAIAIGQPPRRAVVVVDVDASGDLRRLADAAADGPWALVGEDGRVLAPAGGPALERPAGLDAWASGTVVEGEAIVSALAVPGVPRGGWQLRARAPSRSRDEVTREVLELSLGALLLLPLSLLLLWLHLTERSKRAAEEQRRFSDTVFDAITDPLVVVDARLVVMVANRAARARHGHDLVGRRYEETVARGRRAPADEVEALRDVLERGRPRRDEVEDALGGAWQVQRWPRSEGGAVTHVVEHARDVTEMRRLQAQLIQSEKLSTLGEMAAGVAHEINNPIAAVSMYAQLLQEELGEALGPDAPALEKLRTIEAQAADVGEIVRSMLGFSRRSDGPRRPYDVRAAIERALGLVEHRKVLDGVTLERALDVDPPPVVVGSEGQLAQVVHNLVVNAAHAMKGRGGAVRVGVTRAREDAYPPGRPVGLVAGNPDRVRVSVADAGVGMPPEVIDRIFEPFYTTKPVGEGTGLGLSVSFAIVREHGGCMWVHSEPGVGTTFTIDLPAEAAGAEGG
ncbi:MAG: ATP-binding protein [Planctomycetes bacterium]|nr:ATP-binding protein [Planctomycetota bacterium]